MFGDDTDGFVRFLSLSNDQDALAEEKVRVITAHAAKGLEFGCVFIPGHLLGHVPDGGLSRGRRAQPVLCGHDPGGRIACIWFARTAARPPFFRGFPRECCEYREDARRERKEQLLLF
ncbi:MAG: 3'-5' exonuclease [Desulfomonilia bacterium]